MAPMGIFGSRYYYPTPERYTLSVAREKRLNAMLAQDRRFADIANFNNRKAALFQANKLNNALLPKAVNDQKAFGHKAALIAAALSQFSEKDLSDPAKRTQYRTLRQQQVMFRELASREGQAKVTPTGGDKRRYNPTGKLFAATTSGNIARLVSPRNTWVRVFKNPGSVIPCIQRSVRREVMFAKKFAGKGYKVRHRRSWSTGVPC